MWDDDDAMKQNNFPLGIVKDFYVRWEYYTSGRHCNYGSGKRMRLEKSVFFQAVPHCQCQGQIVCKVSSTLLMHCSKRTEISAVLLLSGQLFSPCSFTDNIGYSMKITDTKRKKAQNSNAHFQNWRYPQTKYLLCNLQLRRESGLITNWLNRKFLHWVDPLEHFCSPRAQQFS